MLNDAGLWIVDYLNPREHAFKSTRAKGTDLMIAIITGNYAKQKPNLLRKLPYSKRAFAKLFRMVCNRILKLMQRTLLPSRNISS